MPKAMPILLILLLACLAARPPLLKLADPLPGTWAINLTPNGTDGNIPGVKAFDETLIFTTYQLTAKTLAAHGFGPGTYNEDTQPMGVAKFTCTQTSDTEGKIDWQGMTTTGQDLSGTLTWTKKDGTVVHYDFQGNKAG
jgi:hypothetical protein